MKTIKLYDADAYATRFEARVLSCEKSAHYDGAFDVVLDQTLFFPEEGGQTPDKGTIAGIRVLDVQIHDEVLVHTIEKEIEKDTLAEGEIEWEHRFFNMQQHSGEHIFSGLADKKYGYQNVGFHLSDQIVTMDFDHPFTEEELAEMEWEVNEAIAQNAVIRTGYPSKEELDAMDYRSKKEIHGDIRIVEIEGYDRCACCAPHVRNTGEIGVFKIVSAQNYKGGMRISFLCGFRALQEYRRKSEILSELTGLLSTNQENLAEQVSKMKVQIQSLKTQLSNAKQTIMESKIVTIPAEQTDVVLFERDLQTPVMRSVVNRLTEVHEGFCAVFVGNEESGYNFIVGSKNKDCKSCAEKMKEQLNARGGGSVQMIQGSVPAKEEQIRVFFENL